MTSTMQAAPKKQAAARRNAPKPTDESRLPMHEDIVQRARELYEESGCRAGRDEELWLEAERQLKEMLRD